MRFDTLFNEYYYSRKGSEKVTVKEIDDTVQKASKSNVLLVSFFVSLLIAAIITNIIQFWIEVPVVIPGIIWIVDLVLLIIIAIVNSNAKKSYDRVKNIDRKYSKNRINETVSILKEYKIDVTDKETLKLLIDEANENKVKYDCFAQFKKPLKAVYALLVPAAVCVGEKFAEIRLEKESAIDLVNRLQEPIVIFILLTILLLVFSTIVFPELDKLIKCKYYYHDEFIEDIRQIILFYKEPVAQEVEDENQQQESIG